jgi:hypothetical protein
MSIRRCIPAVLAVLLGPTLALQPDAAAQRAAEATPKLVVILAVDQLRADYLERYSAGMTGGVRRLMRDGAWFDRAAYPYLNTVTCPGHATISTGAFPYRHGMILNAWIDRRTGQSVACTTDPETKQIGYSGQTGVGDSTKSMRVPALADQIREGTGGRVVAFSLKPRAAATLAGRKAEAVVWYDERGGFATSTAYTDRPVPFLEKFFQEHPITADFGKVWQRALEPSAYQHADDADGECPPSGWTRSFPHELGQGSKPDALFYAHWQRTPYADEYLGRMAAASVDALQLGRGTGTDFLGVSFSTLDSVGHAFGPNSHEVQDILVRLDVTIGRLLDHLDRTVGRSNYVVGVSSDHGVAGVPEQTPGGGRQYSHEIRNAINAALRPFLGDGNYVMGTAYTDLYLAPGVLDQLKRNKQVRTAVLEALVALPGIDRAFTADEIADANARRSRDRVTRAAALSYYAERSGDIIVVPRENWILATSTTTHGTLHAYDQLVPVIFYGAGVKPGRYSTEATPADLAPTLAALAGVRFASADGHVLKDAMAAAGRTSKSVVPEPATK